jgi:hypothetical protein
VSKQDDQKEIAQLEQLNDELTESLERCRGLLFECRSKLAANGNEPGSEEAPAIRFGD